MKIEVFHNITIGYMRHIGPYGPQNQILMQTFKDFLQREHLFNGKTVILGIALDNPKSIPVHQLRYDVGIIIDEHMKTTLNIRKIDDGSYAVFEVTHTEQAIRSFWNDIASLISDLPVDDRKPIIERYSAEKISRRQCEFCIPLKA